MKFLVLKIFEEFNYVLIENLLQLKLIFHIALDEISTIFLTYKYFSNSKLQIYGLN